MPPIAANAKRGPSPPLRIVRPSERRSQSRSAMRALDILEFLGDARRPLRAFEISKMLGSQPSSTDQLLKTMVDSGHLVFDARAKTYLPSPRLIGFSSWLIDIFGADDRLRALVRDVQARSGMVVTLTTPNDLFMQVIDIAVPVGSRAERGLRISLFGSVIGSAYLATLACEDLERLANRARIAPKDLPEIRRALVAIRESGFADGPTSDGKVWSIAMRLPAPGLVMPLILGLAGPQERVLAESDALRCLMSEAVAHRITSLPG